MVNPLSSTTTPPPGYSRSTLAMFSPYFYISIISRAGLVSPAMFEHYKHDGYQEHAHDPYALSFTILLGLSCPRLLRTGYLYSPSCRELGVLGKWASGADDSRKLNIVELACRWHRI